MKPAATSLLAIGIACVVACGGPSEAPATPTSPATSSATTSATASTATPSPSPAQPTTPTPAASGSASPDATPVPSASAAAVTAPKATPTKISARHILIQWMGAQNAGSSVVRTREQALVVAKDVLRRARAGEDFARLAVEFSDEPNASQRGGSLGRFGRGAMVKSFEDAAFALQPGEISGVVESPFGYHIIQRTE